jgi:hypothetical protein
MMYVQVTLPLGQTRLYPTQLELKQLTSMSLELQLEQNKQEDI